MRVVGSRTGRIRGRTRDGHVARLLGHAPHARSQREVGNTRAGVGVQVLRRVENLRARGLVELDARNAAQLVLLDLLLVLVLRNVNPLRHFGQVVLGFGPDDRVEESVGEALRAILFQRAHGLLQVGVGQHVGIRRDVASGGVHAAVLVRVNDVQTAVHYVGNDRVNRLKRLLVQSAGRFLVHPVDAKPGKLVRPRDVVTIRLDSRGELAHVDGLAVRSHTFLQRLLRNREGVIAVKGHNLAVVLRQRTLLAILGIHQVRFDLLNQSGVVVLLDCPKAIVMRSNNIRKNTHMSYLRFTGGTRIPRRFSY